MQPECLTPIAILKEFQAACSVEGGIKGHLGLQYTPKELLEYSGWLVWIFDSGCRVSKMGFNLSSIYLMTVYLFNLFFN